MKNGFRYFMTMASVCGLVGAAVGVCSGTAGLFYKAIAQDLGISVGSISVTYTITAIAGAFAGLLIPKILKKPANLKLMILAACALMIGGTFLLSTAGSLFFIYLYSGLRGIGSGLLSFVLATMIINQWFLAKNGLMVSVAMAFSGLPGVLLSNLFSGVIERSGWRFAYVFVAGVMTLFCLPALLYPLKLKPSMTGMKAYGYEEYMKFRDENPDIAVVTQSNDSLGHRMLEMFLVLLFSVFCCVLASVLQHLPSYAASLGFAASVGALMTSAASAANISSKLIYGVASEKAGPFRTSAVCAFISLASIALLITVHTAWAMVLGAFLFGFTFANSSSALSIITRNTFGMENYTRIYPTVSFAGAAANAVGVTLLGMLYDLTGTYMATMILCVILQLCVLLVIFALNKIVKASNA